MNIVQALDPARIYSSRTPLSAPRVRESIAHMASTPGIGPCFENRSPTQTGGMKSGSHLKNAFTPPMLANRCRPGISRALGRGRYAVTLDLGCVLGLTWTRS